MKIHYRFFKLLWIAIRFLLKHKLRSALSVSGVVCGVMAVFAMISIGEGARQEAISQIEQLGTKNIYLKAIPLTEIQKKKAREKMSRGLTIYDAVRIRKTCPTVRNVACLKELSASLLGSIKEFSPQIVACSASYRNSLNLFVSQGRFITEQDIYNKNLVCILGDSVARNLGIIGKIGGQICIENHLFRVIGILERYNRKTQKTSVVSVRNFNDMIFIPLGTEKAICQKRITRKNHYGSELSEIIVKVDKTENVLGTAPIIKRIMEVSHSGVDDYQIVIPQELLRQSQKTQRIFNIVLGAIAGISLLVGGIGIMNIMLATVSERTREIGIRRAIGATQEDIIIQFLTETIVLTFTGGLIGIGAGIGSVWIITAWAGWSTDITLYAIMIPLVMSILVGIFFGMYPAYQAAKMDPIAALRQE